MTTQQQDEQQTQKIANKLIKGKLGKGMMAIGIINEGLTIAGGLIIATLLPAAVPFAFGAVAASAGAYRLYNTVKGHLELQRDPEAAMKKAEEEKKNKTDGEKLFERGVNLVLGAGVLGTGILLFTVTAPLSIPATIGAVLLGAKMAIGGGFSVIGNTLGLAWQAIKGTSKVKAATDAVGQIATAVKALEEPAPAPALTQKAATPAFDAAATPVNDNAPQPAAKAPDVKAQNPQP